MTEDEIAAYMKKENEEHPEGLVAQLHRHNEDLKKQAAEFDKNIEALKNRAR